MVLALTDHSRCSASDPLCVFHSYTLVQNLGPGILALAGAPLAISLVLVAVLRSKTTHRGPQAHRAAWVLATFDCFICLGGMLIAGLTMLPPAVLTVCAVATTPSPPDPTDRLNQAGGSYFAR